MKLGAKDKVERVYYTQNGVEVSIEYKEKKILLNNLKAAKRDTRGTKIRI